MKPVRRQPNPAPRPSRAHVPHPPTRARAPFRFAPTPAGPRSPIRVSYCTTCHGRLWQLALTLFDNLERLRPDEELVLVDYGSPDGLGRFIESSARCRRAIQRGRLVYARTEAAKYDCQRAKNLAHRLGRGDILANLDADNSNFGMRRAIDQAFAGPFDDAFLHLDNGVYAGTYGRICFPRYWFYRLGAYDESFLPSGYQDTDLIHRAAALGLRYLEAATHAPAPIRNTMSEKAAHTGQESWRSMWNANRATSERNLAEGRLVANLRGWGGAKVRINFGENQTLEPIPPALISIVLLGSVRRSALNQLLELYNRMPLVGEILLLNGPAARSLERVERPDSKLSVVNPSQALGPLDRLAVATQASYPAVLLAPNRIFLPEPTLTELHQGWWTDPAILHSVVPEPSGETRRHRAAGASACQVVPAGGVLTTVPDCFRSLCYASRLRADLGPRHIRRGQDILLSYVVTSGTGRANLAYRLPVEPLYGLGPAVQASPAPLPEDSPVTHWCRQNVVP